MEKKTGLLKCSVSISVWVVEVIDETWLCEKKASSLFQGYGSEDEHIYVYILYMTSSSSSSNFELLLTHVGFVSTVHVLLFSQMPPRFSVICSPIPLVKP